MSNVKPLYPHKYIDYVVTSGVKLDHWCREELYEKYSVTPEIITKIPNLKDENDDYLGVDYSKIVPVLVESIKEQNNEINSLKQMNNELMKRLELLESKIN